jgi:23S rRNA (adenine2503-C2)-methyltransferase
MRIIASMGRDDIARVFLAEIRRGGYIEFVESLQPPIPRSEKWVLIVSSMLGCPIGCAMCDAGGDYRGSLAAGEIAGQVDYLIRRRFPDGAVPSKKFKIQFARMGEPSLNPAVLDVLRDLPERYDAPGLMPSISSVAPSGSERFFESLIAIKREKYPGGRFQLQFSIHTTDPALRDRMIPARKWDLAEIARYGDAFCGPGDRKVTLNFALAAGAPLDSRVLAEHFHPDRFLIKITPINPTHRASLNQLRSYVTAPMEEDADRVVGDLRSAGFEVLVSIGEMEENLIGSTCGQYVKRHLEAGLPLEGAYKAGISSCARSAESGS